MSNSAPDCRLLEVDEIFVGRPALGAEFAYRDADGEVLADVQVLHTPENSKLGAMLAGESTRHVDERWLVVHDEAPVFFVERYRASGSSSYGVYDPEGGPLGTYVADGMLHRNVVVREASSAPVATIRVSHHRHVITQADGTELGWCWRAFSAIGNDEDDEVWGLRLEASRSSSTGGHWWPRPSSATSWPSRSATWTAGERSASSCWRRCRRWAWRLWSSSAPWTACTGYVAAWTELGVVPPPGATAGGGYGVAVVGSLSIGTFAPRSPSSLPQLGCQPEGRQLAYKALPLD